MKTDNLIQAFVNALLVLNVLLWGVEMAGFRSTALVLFRVALLMAAMVLQLTVFFYRPTR